jgi:cytochrome c551
MRVLLSLLGSIVWLGIELSCATARDGSPFEGRRVFLRENCYGCHGGRGGGGMGPNLRDHRPNDETIRRVVQNGTPTGMPPYGQRVKDVEIQNLIAYIRRLRNNDEPTFTHWWEPVPTQ